MNRRIRSLAKDNLEHIRYTKYGESVEEDFYEFYPYELEEFSLSILNRVLEMVKAHESIFDKPDERALIKHIARSIQIDFEIK